MGLFKTKLERLEIKAKKLEKLQEQKTIDTKLKLAKERELNKKQAEIKKQEDYLKLRISKAKKLGLTTQEKKQLKQKKQLTTEKLNKHKKKAKKVLNIIGQGIINAGNTITEVNRRANADKKEVMKNRKYRKYMLSGLNINKLNHLNKVFNKPQSNTKNKAYQNIYMSNIASNNIRKAILGEKLKRNLKTYTSFK